jgi:hypothetical protein
VSPFVTCGPGVVIDADDCRNLTNNEGPNDPLAACFHHEFDNTTGFCITTIISNRRFCRSLSQDQKKWNSGLASCAKYDNFRKQKFAIRQARNDSNNIGARSLFIKRGDEINMSEKLSSIGDLGKCGIVTHELAIRRRPACILV